MTKENTQEFAVALNSSPSEGAGEGSEAKRNKKTQLLSALLSASALGLFLEGCGGGGGGGTPTPPTPAILGTESNPYLATANADTFSGSGSRDWVSYENSNAGVTIDLSTDPATVSGDWAVGDRLSGINNLIGSRYDDTLSGNSGANTLRGRVGIDRLNGRGGNDILEGGVGNDILNGGAGDNILEGGSGQDDYVFDSYNGNDEIRSDTDGGRLLFPNGSETDTFYLSRDENGVTVATAEGGSTFIHIAASAYQHGGFSIYVGSEAEDTLTLVGRIHVGDDDVNNVTGDSSKDIISGLGGNDYLQGGSGDDDLYGGAGNDLLDGGRGDDLLAGGSGDDIYRFDAGDGTDTISSMNDGTGNKVVFRAPAGVTYADNNFDFDRGNRVSNTEFTEETAGDDLRIVVSQGGSTRNTVYIEGYFDQQDNAYTISHTHSRSNDAGTSVSAPAETS